MTATAEQPVDRQPASGPDPATAAPAGAESGGTISVKGLWKVFGPAEHKLIGTPDADLTNAEIRAKHGSTVACHASALSTRAQPSMARNTARASLVSFARRLAITISCCLSV